MEHITTVGGGMFMDTAPELQPQGTYYRSQDGEIVDNGNGNYAWRTKAGNVYSFAIETGFKPLGFINLRDKMIIFSSNGTIDSIMYATFDTDGTLLTKKGIYAGTLNFHFDYMIEALVSPETANYQRIYWVDDRNPPRTLNIAAVVYVVSGDIQPGQQYTVVQGSITYDSVPYTIGQTFTGVPAVTGFIGTGIVIEYINPQTLNFFPSFTIAQSHFYRFIAGDLMSGGYFVAMQFESTNGIISDWGFITDVIPVYKADGVGDIDDYQLVPDHNTTVPIATGNGFRIEIRNIDLMFSRVKVAVFYSDDLDVIQDGYIVDEVDITGTSMYFDVVEYAGIPITPEELLLRGVHIEKAGTIAQIKGQLVLGRLTELTIPKWNNIYEAHRFSMHEIPYDYKWFHHSPPIIDSPVGLTGHYSFDKDAGGVLTGYIYPAQWYHVTVATVTYEGVVYGPAAVAGEYFQGVHSATGHQFTPLAGAIVTPVIRIRKYDDALGNPVYETYEIPASWLDYKNPLICQKLKSFYGGETYRIGVIPISLSGQPMRVKWLQDITIPYRNNPGVGTQYPMMKSYDAFSTAYGAANKKWNINVMSILMDLDISQFIVAGQPIVKGFSIVAAPLDRKIITDIFFTHIIRQSANEVTNRIEIPYTLAWNYDLAREYSPWVTFFDKLRETYLQGFYSPEILFGVIENLPIEELRMKFLDLFEAELQLSYPYGGVDAYWTTAATALFKNGTYICPLVGIVPSRHLLFQKFFKQSINAGFYGEKGNDALIQKNVKLGLNEIYSYLKLHGSTYLEFCNKGTVYYEDGSDGKVFAEGSGEKMNLVELDVTRLGYDYLPWNKVDLLDAGFYPLLHYGCIERNLTLPYGGTSDSAKENTQYRFMEHYLELTPSVIAAASLGGGVYKLYNIQIFGDAYVYPWDIQRMYPTWWIHNDWLIGGDDHDRFLGHGIIAPIQSFVNIALRRGKHVAKDRTTDLINGYYPVGGLYYNAGVAASNYRLDEHLYEKGMSSRMINQIFLAQLENYENSYVFDYRYRWSGVKVYGESVDQYLSFAAADFRDLPPNYGQLTNLREKLGKLYYWQEDMVGYIPVSERALIANSVSEVELGTGSAFVRFDGVLGNVGSRHQFSLVETSDSFIWVDYKRRNIIQMGLGFDKILMSKVNGIDSFMTSLPPVYLGLFSPANYNGIYSAYLEKEEKVVISFFLKTMTASTSIGVLYNNLLKKVESFSSQGIALNINMRGYPQQYHPGQESKIYLYNKSSYKMFDTYMQPYIEVIINPQFANQSNVFDNAIMCGNANFFSQVIYTNVTGTVTDNVFSATEQLLSRYYRYQNTNWSFSFPLVGGRKRFRGNYLKIKFVMDYTREKVINFLSLSTVFRKIK